MPCLSDENLAAIVEGRVTPEQIATWNAHVSTCDNCTLRFGRLQAGLTDSLNESNPHELKRGDRIRVSGAKDTEYAVFDELHSDLRATPPGTGYPALHLAAKGAWVYFDNAPNVRRLVQLEQITKP